MRPTQSLLLLFVLLSCGVAAFFIFKGGEGGTQGIARSIDIRELHGEEDALQPDRKPSDLVSPEDDENELSAAGRSDLTDPEARPEAERSGLAAERMVRGRVEDSAGRPISGAEIYVAQSMGNMGFIPIDLAAPGDEASRWIKRKKTVSDEDGRFQVESPRGAAGNIAIRASGYAPFDDQVALRSTDSTDVGALKLQDGVILAGRVLDESGRPVEGVVLRAQATDGGGMGITIFAGESGRYLTETDRDGQFRVDKLEAGPFRIRFLHEEYPTETLEDTAPRPGLHRSDYLVELRSSKSIEGLVTGLPDKLPEYLRVSASPKIDSSAAEDTLARASRRTAKLQEDGRFRIAGLVEGVEYIVSLREGQGNWQGERLSQSVSAMSGTNDVVLEWRIDAAVELRAVDATTGEPIENFEIAAGIDWTETLRGEDGRPLTRHPDGRARFSGLHPRKNSNALEVEVEAIGYEPWERRGLALAEGEQLNLGDIALTPVPLFVVTVLDSKTGNPIRRARVTISDIDPSKGLEGEGVEAAFSATASISLGDSGVSSFEDFSAFDENIEEERTAEDGTARFSARPGKSVLVRVRHSAYAEARSEPIPFAASGTADVEWTARLLRGGEVLLSAKDPKGKPLVGRPIEHRPPNQEGMGSEFTAGFSQRKTDEQGIIRYEHLAAGTHKFRLGKGESGGAFLIGGGVDSFISFAPSGMGGEDADADSDRPWSQVLVVEGAEHTVEVVGPAQVKVKGIVNEEGSPLAGATIRMTVSEGDDGDEIMDPFMSMGAPSARTGSDGSWSIDGLEPGDYELRISHSTRSQPAVFDVTLAEGENDLGTTNLAVSIIEGRVESGGEPVAGARVRVSLADGEGISTARFVTRISIAGDDGSMGGLGSDGSGTVRTDEEGYYRLRGVEPDRNLFVNVEGEGYQPKRSELVRLSPGEIHTDFDLEISVGGTLEVVAVRPDGTPVSEVFVTARYTGSESGVGSKNELADSEGKVKFSGLASGAWVVTVRNLDFGGDGPAPVDPQEKTVEVVPGETAEARFEVPD